jgi:ParB-like chromosome segregation protein Spo0J
MKLTGSDARKAIAVLVSQGKLKAAHVAAAIRSHHRLVSELRQRLAALESVVPVALARRPRATRKARKRVSAKRRAAMARQGKYLAAIRRLSAQDRAKVKAVLASKGYSAAMQQAKGLTK